MHNLCRRLLTLGVFLGGVFFLRSAVAEAQEMTKGLARFHLTSFKEQLKELAGLHLDITGVNYAEQTVELALTQGELERVRDLLSVAQMQLQSFTEPLAPDQRYYSSEEVAAKLESLARQYPGLLKVEVIGKSVDGRDILAAKVSDNVGKTEPEEPTILFNAMHHAREVMTTEVVMDTMELLLSSYAKDAKLSRWVDMNEIWLVPMLNPDGNHKVWNNRPWWRKNARGDYGIDINRNYPYKWGQCNGSSSDAGAEDYRGPSAASEPETKALMGLVERIRPVFNISYHSFSELVLYPYGCEGERSQTREVIEALGQRLAASIPSDEGRSTYRAGTPWELLYSVDGSDMDWMYASYQVIPFVIELNSSRQGFQPAYSYRQPTVEKARIAWALLLERLGASGIRGTLPLQKIAGLEVVARNLDNDQGSVAYKVGQSGGFHLVLNPGDYQLEVRNAKTLLWSKSVRVGDELVHLEPIDFAQ